MTLLAKSKRGRPKKPVDLEMVEKLAHIQCTHVEIASALNVSVDTLTRNPHFAEVFKRGAEGGRKSLRRMQFESANKGNIAMQIWLGKQYLGQSEHVTSEIRRLPSLREYTAEDLKDILEDHFRSYPELVDEVATIEAQYSVEKPTQSVRPTNLLAAPSDIPAASP
jgi:hypothetical protein